MSNSVISEVRGYDDLVAHFNSKKGEKNNIACKLGARWAKLDSNIHTMIYFWKVTQCRQDPEK
jgi:hypothetical protein